MNIKEKIIDYIRVNRVSSTEVADALEKSGVIENVFALNSGHFKVGSVKWVCAYDESNWPLHEMIQNVQKDEIVIVDAINCKNRAVLGDLVSKYLFLYNQISALVVIGSVRDVPHLKKENWSIWCKGVTPIGCFNTKVNLDENIINNYREKYIDSIAVCDDSGVVIIPKEKINEEFYKKLEFMENQEDTWFYNLDKKKMSTYEIVCLKKYLD